MMIDYRADGLDFGVVGLPTSGVGRGDGDLRRRGWPSRTARRATRIWRGNTSSIMTSRRRAACGGSRPGLAISGNKRAAAHFAGNPVEDAFLEEVQYRPVHPGELSVDRYPFIEELGSLKEMMEDILYSERRSCRSNRR